MFDILITVSAKDWNKLPFVLDSIHKNIRGFRNIYVISPSEVPDKYLTENVHLVFDHEVLSYDFSKIKMENRRGWYRQQFIKLFQQITLNNYLVVDADVYINKPFEVSTDNPFFYIGRDQLHKPYFECFKLICGLDKIYPHSFISEVMHFKRRMIRYILFDQGLNILEFIDKCVDCINHINDASSFSEYEFYGNYVVKRFPNFYRFKNIKVCYERRKRLWTNDEIKTYIEANRSSDYDLLTMHSWI